jgi:hypothetical protein
MTTAPATPVAATQDGSATSTFSQMRSGFDAYTAAMDDSPLLGHLVLYSIFDGRVTPDQLERWFIELGLDRAFLPRPIRPVGAFEKVTGPTGVRLAYPLDDIPASGRRRRTSTDGTAREAILMVRHVRRDAAQIVRHLVREVRDEQASRLSYDSRLAEIVFRRDGSTAAAPGAGSLQVIPDHAAIRALAEGEQLKVSTVLDQIHDRYRLHCKFLTGDRLRVIVRTYIEGLNAIRVRPTGGVYFVHRAHAGSLTQLRELVSRMGAGSNLARVPLPDQLEMRQMVINALTTKTKEDLQQLARDIAAAQADPTAGANVQALYRRFQELQAATADHSRLLSNSLVDTTAALQLVNVQLASLLTQAE